MRKYLGQRLLIAIPTLVAGGLPIARFGTEAQQAVLAVALEPLEQVGHDLPLVAVRVPHDADLGLLSESQRRQ
jgi:hypothetical protein